MKVKVRVEGARISYDAYFDSYADAQSEITDFLRKRLQDND